MLKIPATTRRVPCWLGTVLLFIAFSVRLFSAFQQQDPEPGRDVRPQGNSGISLDGLWRFLGHYEGNGVSEAMAVKLIEMHGLDFRPSPEDMAKLREASASEALIKAIEAARKPPSPPPVVLQKEGWLSVVCEPGDCEVRVDGDLIGTTSHGALLWATPPRDSLKIAATRESYEPTHGRQEVAIRSDETTRVEFQFRPSRAALVSAGAAVFRQMIDSLGVEAGGKDSAAVRATGTFYVHNGSEHRTAWSVVAWLGGRDLARFEVSRLREKYEITRTERGYVWKKPPWSKEAQDLEDAIRLVMEGQLPMLMERLKEPLLTMVAADLNPLAQTPAVFRAEGTSEAYVITLDSAYRPSEIRLESSGLTSGLRILYSDYVRLGSTIYPRTTQIIFPDGGRGVESRFATVEIGRFPASDRKGRSK